MKNLINNPKIVLVACLTLGLAPFAPEPHILGKVRWIMGGAEGMQLMDWWDTIMHGFPFLLLIRILTIRLFFSEKAIKTDKSH